MKKIVIRKETKGESGTGIANPLLRSGERGDMESESSLSRYYFSDGDDSQGSVEIPGYDGEDGSHGRRYDYMELSRATKSFSEECEIGKGMSGVVYRGLLEGQQQVAIKVLSGNFDADPSSSDMKEITVLSKMHHPNLVQLLGWCHHCRQLALVFEFVPNGSLANHLYRNNDLPWLPWKVRYWRVVVGLASALLYLHEKRDVVHRNIKPSNVMLDSDFNPKLGDFGISGDLGISRFAYSELASYASSIHFSPVETRETKVYIAPECFLSGELTKKSDIYSFGIVALQVASGKMATYDKSDVRSFLRWVEELHQKGRILEAADPKLSANEFNVREVERLLLVGLRCTHFDPESRPSIEQILQLLTFGTREDRLLSVLGQEDELTTSVLLEQTVYDIGIPRDFSSTEIREGRKDHHRDILKGFVGSLHEMMQCEGNMRGFDEALELIKTCTSCLVQVVGPPLDDWNTIAQLVLGLLKERDDFFNSCDDQEALSNNVTMLSLDERIRRCIHVVEEDIENLECDVKERLRHAQQECINLEPRLAQAREITFSIEAEMKAMEQRIARNLSTIEQRRRRYAILEKYRDVLNKLSSFTC